MVDFGEFGSDRWYCDMAWVLIVEYPEEMIFGRLNRNGQCTITEIKKTDGKYLPSVFIYRIDKLTHAHGSEYIPVYMTFAVLDKSE